MKIWIYLSIWLYLKIQKSNNGKNGKKKSLRFEQKQVYSLFPRKKGAEFCFPKLTENWFDQNPQKIFLNFALKYKSN